jgi:exodeoxyribonuclease VII large subunit
VHPAARLAQQGERARALGRRLERAFGHARAAAAQRLHALRARLLRELGTPLAQAARVDRVAHALARSAQGRLAGDARKAERLGEALALLNPEAVLERGYAIVTAHDGRVIADACEMRVGDNIALTLARGRALASVTATDVERDR